MKYTILLLLSTILCGAQSTVLIPNIPPYPGDATKFLNGTGAFTVPSGGGGSGNVSTTNTTSNVGDVFTATATDGVHGGWERLSITSTNGFPAPYNGSTDTFQVNLIPDSTNDDRAIWLQTHSSVDNGYGNVYMSLTDPTGWNTNLLNAAYGSPLVIAGGSESFTDAGYGSVTLISAGHIGSGLIMMTTGGNLEAPSQVETNDWLMFLAGQGYSDDNLIHSGAYILAQAEGPPNPAHGIPTHIWLSTVGTDNSAAPTPRLVIDPDGMTHIRSGPLRVTYDVSASSYEGNGYNTHTGANGWQFWTNAQPFGGGVMNFLCNFGDPSVSSPFTNNVDSGTSYFGFVAQRGSGLSIGANESPFGVWIDGIRPAGLKALSDGYNGLSGVGNPMRWGVNTETPGSTLELVNNNPAQSYPIQTWKIRTNNVESVMAQVPVSGGFGSYATGTITTSSTGATNTISANVVLYVTAATSATLKDNAGGTEFSGVTISAFTPVRLQPGGTFVATGVTYATGSASHAW